MSWRSLVLSVLDWPFTNIYQKACALRYLGVRTSPARIWVTALGEFCFSWPGDAESYVTIKGRGFDVLRTPLRYGYMEESVS